MRACRYILSVVLFKVQPNGTEALKTHSQSVEDSRGGRTTQVYMTAARYLRASLPAMPGTRQGRGSIRVLGPVAEPCLLSLFKLSNRGYATYSI